MRIFNSNFFFWIDFLGGCQIWHPGCQIWHPPSFRSQTCGDVTDRRGNVIISKIGGMRIVYGACRPGVVILGSPLRGFPVSSDFVIFQLL